MKSLTAPNVDRIVRSVPARNQRTANRKKGKPSFNCVLLLGVVLLSASKARGDGIPEPGLVMYGVVRNTAAGNIRQTYGTLQWTFEEPGGGTVTVTTLLTNINDQFSYVLHVPFESVLPDLTASSNALALSVTPVVFPRSATVDGTPTTFSTPLQTNFTFSVADRGRMEQVDLMVPLDLPDTDGDGMPDAWETQFGLNPNDPADANLDADGDGLKNLAECKAGTNPNDPQSCFEFIGVAWHAGGGMEVRWSSQPDKQYALERSPEVIGGYTVIRSNIVATPYTNIVWDAAATNAGPCFYRVRVLE